jgi:OOP family OmpA-OmpF porin
MASSSTLPASLYRRRILGAGALATMVLYVFYAPFYNRNIEADLEHRVPEQLTDAGFVGLTASFSGQDGTLSCEAPLDDPEAARAVAFDVKGVRSVDLDRSCRVNSLEVSTVDEPTAAESSDGASAVTADERTEAASGSTTAATDTELATVHDIVVANPDLAFLAVLLEGIDIGRTDAPVTLFAPSNEAFDAIPADVLGWLQNDPELLTRVLSHHVVEGVIPGADLVDGDLTALDGSPLTVVVGSTISVGGATLIGVDITASNGIVHVIDAVILPPDIDLDPEPDLAPAAATFDGTNLTLTGVVASEVERAAIVQAGVDAFGQNAMVEQMTVDPETGLDAVTAQRLAALIAAMPANLASGESGFNGVAMYANGVYLTEPGRDAFLAAAAAVDVEAVLTPPPTATEDDAAGLEQQLNAFVADNPILFEPSSAVLTDSAFSVLDRLARDAQQFGGIRITVEGHTDSDGVPIENLQLSRNRAEAVRTALIGRGIAAAAVDAVGFGSERPVIVDGVEDKGASRRVEFRVMTAP